MSLHWPVGSDSRADHASLGPSHSDTSHRTNTEQRPRQLPASSSSRVNPSPLVKALRLLARLIPGDYLRTFTYLKFIERPRRLLRLALTTFYRMDHIYLVLREFASRKGHFSILEFGTADGYAFTKMLYATKYLGVDNRVVVHTFDTFDGMPSSSDDRNRNLTTQSQWLAGEFRGRYEHLREYCAGRYRNFQIHKGLFHETLTLSLLESLQTSRPILVWIDCDYYTSARAVFDRLIDYLPSGCVVYFDDYDNLNCGSRLTGEARLVHEINHGLYGDDIELVLDTSLSLDTRRVYRFIHFGAEPGFEADSVEDVHYVHHRTNDSPLP